MGDVLFFVQFCAVVLRKPNLLAYATAFTAFAEQKFCR